MSVVPLALLAVQCFLITIFSFFAFFNYLYSVASFRRITLARGPVPDVQVAVVIAAYNEKHVLDSTLDACDALTYADKLIVLADDSDDPLVIDHLREVARARGCRRLTSHPFVEDSAPHNVGGALARLSIEIWESPGFVFFHRPSNVGFKAGSLKKVHEYLTYRRISYMYLLDADWHPQPDAIERTLELLCADQLSAFVQTRRMSFPRGMNLFQRYVTLIEEGCYHVDFQGRQALHHPILFSGCCTLFRLDTVSLVGGFTPGHLTEDLDLTDRFWLAGWKGIYAGHIVNYGEVPFSYDHYRRQQERWAVGSAVALKDFFWALVTSDRLSEPRRVYRRLQLLRGLEHEQIKSIFPRGQGTGCAYGI